MIFCEKHKVSYDWLLCGDLKGLLRMKQKAKAVAAAGASAFKRTMEKYERLSPEEQRIVCDEVDRLLAEQSADEPA